MNREIKIVIGANYGDEGKGLVTAALAKEAIQAKKDTLVICSNGGAQRGHTVDWSVNERHVFHHFGSGIFSGADTYIAPQFMINPIIFCKEYEELSEVFNRHMLRPNIYVNKDCRVTTIYDVLFNRLIEEERGSNKHGSCGLGIFETFNRNKTRYAFTFDDIYTRTYNYIDHIDQVKYYLNQTKEFFKKRAIDLGFPKEKYESILNNKAYFYNFIDDLINMCNKTTLINNPTYFLDNYNTIIIENAQGLLLDMDKEDTVHKTPSSTGLKNIYDCLPSDIIKDSEIEVCYVTRTYMTRHGAGEFPTECSHWELCPTMDIRLNDLTNIPNPYQDEIRFGTLDISDFLARIENDFHNYKPNEQTKMSIAITHEDEVKQPVSNKVFTNHCDYLYKFIGKYGSFIKIDTQNNNTKIGDYKWI